MTTTSTSDETTARRIQDASERKSDGNDHFRQSHWDEALVAYQSGLNRLPRRTKAAAEEEVELPDGEGPSGAREKSAVVEPDTESDAVGDTRTVPLLSEKEEREIAQLRSVLYSNIAACHVKLGEHKQAVAACTEALKDNPVYEKALQRRATANETINTWSSLTAAQEDYKALEDLVSTASQKADIESKLRNLQPRLEAAQKKETAEMLDKMKGFGNSILGKFGMSTDNFKFEPNGQGGYSMNFVN